MDILLGVVVVLAAFYLRTYIAGKAKNLATKEDISEITSKVESIRTQFKSQLHISQVRYEKEFHILTELTQRLVELRDAALGLRPEGDYIDPSETEEQRKQKRLTYYYDKLREFTRTTEIYRPFYPDDIYKLSAVLSKASWREAVQYKVRRMNVDVKYWDDAQKNSEAIVSATEAVMIAIRERTKFWEHQQ